MNRVPVRPADATKTNDGALNSLSLLLLLPSIEIAESTSSSVILNRIGGVASLLMSSTLRLYCNGVALLASSCSSQVRSSLSFGGNGGASNGSR